ncbi:MAG: tetratricopeptide repeat protein [Planctomycetota bacterium]|jgi:tetratricopeptide (TPR) repeat protein
MGRQFLEIISEIEKNFDVNSLCYKNLRVWPWIRLTIIRHLRHDDIKISAARQKEIDGHYCNSILPFRQQDIDYLFFSNHAYHNIGMEGAYYSPFIDPYIELIKDKHTFLKVESSSRFIESTSPRYVPTVFLKTAGRRFDYPLGENDIVNFASLREYVQSLCGVELDEADIIYTVNKIEQYRYYFLDFLRQIRPRVVLLVCWYGDITMGLIWACNDLGITSVDLQHGIIFNNPIYEGWSATPPDGYELVPDIFHVWGKAFKDSIEKKQPVGCRYHLPVSGGNAWMCEVIRNDPAVDDVSESFLQYLEQKEKVILVTLQRPGPLPDHLLEAMKRLPGNWLWLVRCHPRYGKGEIGNVAEQLCSHDISNFDVENATKQPLFSLLKYAHHHITAFSTVSLEALLYGVPTTFFSPDGYGYFKEYVDAGFFNYAPSADALVQYLSLDYDKAGVSRMAEYFFQMDNNVIRKAFEGMLDRSSQKIIYPVADNYRAGSCNEVGKIFFNRGDFQKAASSFQNAIAFNPTDPEAYNNLGGLCWHLGRTEDAAKCIEAALRINPRDHRTVQNYSELVKTRKAGKVFPQPAGNV